jgi:hypothetical protein
MSKRELKELLHQVKRMASRASYLHTLRRVYRLRSVRAGVSREGDLQEDETPEPSKQFIELNKQFFVDNPRVPCTTKS